jgi:hypothetical protein
MEVMMNVFVLIIDDHSMIKVKKTMKNHLIFEWIHYVFHLNHSVVLHMIHVVLHMIRVVPQIIHLNYSKFSS